MSLDISATTAARLAARAQELGLSIDAFLERLLNDAGELKANATSGKITQIPGAVDANILVYAVDTGSPQHAASHNLLEAATNPATVLYLTSQILCEFYSIVTNPRRIAAPYSPAEALEAISALLALPGTRVLPTPAQAVVGWMALLQRVTP